MWIYCINCRVIDMMFPKHSGQSSSRALCTNGTEKQAIQLTHPPARNGYSVFSSGKQEVSACKGKHIYCMNCLHMVSFPVTADSLFWRPAWRKLWRATPEAAAAQRHERVLRGRSHLSSPTPLSWARVLKHRPDVLFPSLHLMRLLSYSATFFFFS